MHPNDGRVISNFIVQALRDEPITIYGDGSQTRSFCYVDDMVSGLILMMSSEAGFTGPCNLGNPREFTIDRLARLVLELTQSSSGIVRRQLPQDDPKRRCPDISLAKDVLGWEPSVSLEDGLRATVEYFRRKLAL